jgi:hypothetical protein
MNYQELLEEINTECADLERTVSDLTAIIQVSSDRDLSVYERAGVAMMLASFYNGVENILKRLCKYQHVKLPVGETWHIDLFKRFCEPSLAPLPLLFSKEQEDAWGKYRRFRHVVHHGYAFRLEWDFMLQGVLQCRALFDDLQDRIKSHLQTLES